MSKDSLDYVRDVLIDGFERIGDKGVLLRNGKSLTGSDLVRALQEETEEGNKMLGIVLMLTVELLKRDKISDRSMGVAEHLDGMIACDPGLYERILETTGFAYHFNELTNLALGK